MVASVLELAANEFADLAGRLERARDLRDAGVVLLDATGELPERFEITTEDLRSVTLFELPVLFAFEGAVSRGLAELALACDLRICGERASMKGRLKGNARARTLADETTALALFLGQREMPAEALLAAGLVSHVTPAGGALGEARRQAEVIASRGPLAVRLAKEAIWRGLAQPLEQALRFETDLTLLLQTTKDRAEGVRAFLEKRPPIFTGE
ncbi:MAG: enoyl-CoA hydratase-related protein [bacterium]